MTRFLLTLDKAADTVFAALVHGRAGDTYVPKVPSANITDVAKALLNGKDLPIIYTGIRPGEKLDEIMVSEEECFRTRSEGDYYAIGPVLPELRKPSEFVPALRSEYSSKADNISVEELRKLLGTANDEIKRFLTARS